MKAGRTPRRRIQLSNFKLNTLLEITQGINDNISTDELLLTYQKTLREGLNIGHLSVFSRQQDWKCLLTDVEEFRSFDANEFVSDNLSKYYEISNVTSILDGVLAQFDVVIPVYHKDVPVAYVLIGDFEEEQAGISPTIKHLHYIQTITNVIVVAIENKRLYNESLRQEAMKKELELASRMQAMLIPDKDTISKSSKVQVASYYKPHSGVSGDYYDFIFLNEDEFGFCIADVSGKGISAAIVMSNFQANLRALFSSEISLEKLIVRLNDSVNYAAKGEKFITFFIGKYNAQNRSLRYVNAGHNPPLLYKAVNGEKTFLKKGCMGLGMLDEIPFVNTGEIALDPEDRLICYTDGLVEAENAHLEEFGTHDLERVIGLGGGINESLSILRGNLDGFLGDCSLNDDISLIGIRFL